MGERCVNADSQGVKLVVCRLGSVDGPWEYDEVNLDNNESNESRLQQHNFLIVGDKDVSTQSAETVSGRSSAKQSFDATPVRLGQQLPQMGIP